MYRLVCSELESEYDKMVVRVILSLLCGAFGNNLIFAIKKMERSNLMFLVPKDNDVAANDRELEVTEVTQGVPFDCEVI